MRSESEDCGSVSHVTGVYESALNKWVHNTKRNTNSRMYGEKWVRDAGRAHTKIILDDITDNITVRCHETDVISINTLRGQMTLDMSYMSKSTSDSISIGLGFLSDLGFDNFSIKREKWNWNLYREGKKIHTFGNEREDGQFVPVQEQVSRVHLVNYEKKE